MNLRSKEREYRASLPPEEKSRMDHIIFNRLLSDGDFHRAGLILAYVSTPIEVDTHAIITYSIKAGKRVAVPRCVDGTRLMEFVEISSMADLAAGAFGVLEPDLSKGLSKIDPSRRDLSGSVCIVPGLAFDRMGYRLGYGKGYYDRFLSDYPGKTIGICYSGCVHRQLPHGRMDRAVDLLITDRAYIKIAPMKIN